MKASFGLMFQTAKVLALFVGFTVLFYMGMIWLNQEFKDYHRYDEPKGTAVKVAALDDPEENNWLNRVLLFYLNGE
jgi:hypothetical protein